jgi:hypothetical protein
VALDAPEATTLLDVASAALLAAVEAEVTEALVAEAAVVPLPAPQALSKEPDSRTHAEPAACKNVRRVICLLCIMREFPSSSLFARGEFRWSSGHQSAKSPPKHTVRAVAGLPNSDMITNGAIVAAGSAS